MSEIFRLPLCSFVSGGVKVTDTLQLLPGLSVLHSDVTVNTDGDALSLSMFTAKFTAKPVFLLPAFLIVTVLALLVFPTVTDPNASEAGLNVSFSEIGVGVAVGV